MTQSERNLWQMARAAVASRKEDEGYRELLERGTDTKNLQLYLFYVQVRKSIEKLR